MVLMNPFWDTIQPLTDLVPQAHLPPGPTTFGSLQGLQSLDPRSISTKSESQYQV